jgi:hypothetical protein
MSHESHLRPRGPAPRGSALVSRAEEKPPGAAARDDQAPFGKMILLHVPPGGCEVSVEELVRDACERVKMVVTVDEALRGKRVRFYASADIDFEMMRAVLRTYDVEILFQRVGERLMMQVCHVRSLGAR